MNPGPKSAKQLQKQCDAFNAKVPIGGHVHVRLDNGSGFPTKTRGEAYVLSGHSAVVMVEGIAGAYLLDRVTPISSSESRTTDKPVRSPESAAGAK